MCVWRAMLVASVFWKSNPKDFHHMKDAPYSIGKIMMWLLGTNDTWSDRYMQTTGNPRCFSQFPLPPRRLQHFHANPRLELDFWLCLRVPHKLFRSWNSRFVDESLRWSEWKNCSKMSFLQPSRSRSKKMQKIKWLHGSLGSAF